MYQIRATQCARKRYPDIKHGPFMQYTHQIVTWLQNNNLRSSFTIKYSSKTAYMLFHIGAMEREREKTRQDTVSTLP